MSFKKTAVIISLASISLLAQGQSKKEHPMDKAEKILFETEEMGIPKLFHQFTNLDFDTRMELQENMCQLKEDKDFSSVISEAFVKDKKATLTLANFNKCYEIVHFGIPLSRIQKETNSLEKAAQMCGFKKMASLIQFYKHPKHSTKMFLDGKTNDYVSALMAEEQVFEDVLNLYDFDTRVKLWQDFATELKIYRIKNPKSDTSTKNYWNNLQKKVKIKLERQKLLRLKTR